MCTARYAFSAIAALYSVFLAASVPSAASTETPKPAPLVSPAAYDHIVLCLSLGKEVVLTKDAIFCASYRQGDEHVHPDTPVNLDMKALCNDPTDRRRLNADTIKKLAANKERPVAPSGIRILGAVFCETLDLVGLDLPYSLVIDRSLFRQGIEVRNLRIRGDFSLDKALVFETLKLLRSRIEGSVFGNNSYIQNLVAFDTTVEGSLLLRKGLLPQAVFDGVTVSGEFSVSGSALSTFLIQLSTIRGSLNLSDSEARCWYRIRKSKIGELVAANVGFGTVDVHETYGYAPWWVRKQAIVARFHASLPWRQSSPPIRDCILDQEHTSATQADQEQPPPPPRFEFALSENRVDSALCVQSFRWLTPTSPRIKVPSYLVINHTSVGSNAIINLRPTGPPITNQAYNPSLETIGLAASGLILNFSDSAKLPKTYVNGLQFERVYSADIGCPHESFSSDGSRTDVSRGSFDERRLHAPTMDEVKQWLATNQTRSTQPFTAFIKAFDLAGDDAKSLRIERAAKELEFQREKRQPRQTTEDQSDITGSVANANVNAGESWLSSFEDGVYVAFRIVLAAVADHGYQPAKALLWIVLLIVVYGLVFWLGLGIVGFKPEKKERIMPVGVLFLFNRLIPLYNLRDEYNHVDTYYRRARRNAPDPSLPPELDAPAQPTTMHYLWFTVPVEPAGEWQTRCSDVLLDVLKIVGVVLAVFLVAAINALVTR